MSTFQHSITRNGQQIDMTCDSLSITLGTTDILLTSITVDDVLGEPTDRPLVIDLDSPAAQALVTDIKTALANYITNRWAD